MYVFFSLCMWLSTRWQFSHVIFTLFAKSCLLMQDSWQTDWNVLQDRISICKTEGIFLVRITLSMPKFTAQKLNFVRKTKHFGRTKWNFARFVRQTSTFHEDCIQIILTFNTSSIKAKLLAVWFGPITLMTDVTSGGSDQTELKCSLIWAFVCHLCHTVWNHTMWLNYA